MYIAFTKQSLSALPFETKSGKRKNYYDRKELNLYIQVGSKTKTFYLLKKMNGLSQRIRIGRFPDISLERARKLSLILKSQFAEGKNLDDIRKSHQKDVTFFDIFMAYMNRPDAIKNKYWKDLNGAFNIYAKPLFLKSFKKVSRHDIKEILNKTSIHSKAQANRLLVVINKMYKKKIEDEELEILNPASGIKRYPIAARDRFLQVDELPIFFKILEGIKSNYFADYVKVSLWTGARRSNVLSMEWAEIDLINKFWTIPANKSKNGDSMMLPLNEKVIEILKKRKELSQSIYVFPSTRNKSKHMTDPKKLWKSFLKKAEIQNLRMHDLRRTFGSYMAISGANLPNIAKALGHKSLQSTAIYARLNLDAVAKSSNQGIEKMMQCLKEK